MGTPKPRLYGFTEERYDIVQCARCGHQANSHPKTGCKDCDCNWIWEEVWMLPAWVPVKRENKEYPNFVRFALGKAGWRCECSLSECEALVHAISKPIDARCQVVLDNVDLGAWLFHRGTIMCAACTKFRYCWESGSVPYIEDRGGSEPLVFEGRPPRT
jgi:hypothetical protein